MSESVTTKKKKEDQFAYLKCEMLVQDKTYRRDYFEYIVIQGIYYILLCLLGFTARVKNDIEPWRGKVLTYYDTLGNGRDTSIRYRREKEFPTFWPPENLDRFPDYRSDKS